MSVYNGEKYLREAMDSVLHQTFPDFEFIIIDDASTDRTASILSVYKNKDSRVKIIQKEKNKGVAGFIENLNLGLAKAKGKYIARMDADDICDLQRLEKQVTFMEEHIDIFIVGSNVQCIDENGSPLQQMEAPLKNDEIKEKMFRRISMFHPTIMFRNTGIQYREKMRYCEDYDLYFRLMTQDLKFANLNETLLQYRILKTSISRKDDKFIRWIFTEKARQFFVERTKDGRDSYDSFDPSSYVKILDKDFKNSREELVFALRTALKFTCKTEADELLSKAEQDFGDDNIFKFFRILSKLPAFFAKCYFKLSPVSCS